MKMRDDYRRVKLYFPIISYLWILHSSCFTRKGGEQGAITKVYYPYRKCQGQANIYEVGKDREKEEKREIVRDRECERKWKGERKE